MPAPPEIPNRGRHIGIIEVFGIGEAADLTKAQGHIGIGGEVQIELQHVAEAAQPGPQHRGITAGQKAEGQEALTKLSQMIRQQTFLGQAHQKASQAQQETVQTMLPMRELLRQRRESHDRALTNDLEVHRIQQRFKERLRRYALFVYIRKVGNQAEDVEGNPQRKQQLRCREPQRSQKKPRILEKDQHQQKHHNAALQPVPGLFAGYYLFRQLSILFRKQHGFLRRYCLFDLSADIPAQYTQGQQKQKAAQAGEAVEEQRKQQQYPIFVPDPRGQEVNREKERQKSRRKDQC